MTDVLAPQALARIREKAEKAKAWHEHGEGSWISVADYENELQPDMALQLVAEIERLKAIEDTLKSDAENDRGGYVGIYAHHLLKRHAKSEEPAP